MARDFGFDIMYYSRVDINEKQHMRNTKKRTQVFRPHQENFGKQKDILGITLDQQRNHTLGNYCWPTGFWADANYLHNTPLVLKKGQPKYNFENLVKNLYKEVLDYMENERTLHVFKMFGCDMAFVDAKVNYKIMDELFSMWHELGFDKDVEIMFSTPNKYHEAMVNSNWEFQVAKNASWNNATYWYGNNGDVNEILNLTFTDNSSNSTNSSSNQTAEAAKADPLLNPDGTRNSPKDTNVLKGVDYEHKADGSGIGVHAQQNSTDGNNTTIIDSDSLGTNNHTLEKKRLHHRNHTLSDKNITISKKKNRDWNLTTTDIGWPIRKDDSFPYAQDKDDFWSGFYSSRPELKKNIKNLYSTFHSSLRLLSQQVLRRDVNDQQVKEVLDYQRTLMELMGVLIHHDSITGTSANRVIGDFNDRAIAAKKAVNEYNAELLRTKLQVDHGVLVAKGKLY